MESNYVALMLIDDNDQYNATEFHTVQNLNMG